MIFRLGIVDNEDFLEDFTETTFELFNLIQEWTRVQNRIQLLVDFFNGADAGWTFHFKVSKTYRKCSILFSFPARIRPMGSDVLTLCQ